MKLRSLLLPPKSPLCAASVGLLLSGWAWRQAPSWRAILARHRGRIETRMHLELIQQGDSGIASMWVAHETFLRAAAARLGIEPEYWGPDGQPEFYGAWVTRELADGAPIAQGLIAPSRRIEHAMYVSDDDDAA